MESLLGQGIELALYGMGTVFVFLTLLIFATRLMSFLARRHGIRSAETVTQLSDRPGDERLVAVITAAINQHLNKK